MPSRIRHLDFGLRLNERVLAPVKRLARMAGVSPAEIVEFLLEEIFEGEVAPPAPRPVRPLAAVIPITRARGFAESARRLHRRAHEEPIRPARAARRR